MTVHRIVLVRHGRAAAGWDVHPDPALDVLGRAQADAVAAALDDQRDIDGDTPWTLRTSPLLRCRQSATPLAQRWSTTAIVDPYVVELPSPDGVPMAERAGWLRTAIDGRWSDLGSRFDRYRARLIGHVAALDRDTVVFSHFIAINAILGAATGDDRIVIARLDNCSRTVIDVDGDSGRLHLVAIGAQADTLIR